MTLPVIKCYLSRRYFGDFAFAFVFDEWHRVREEAPVDVHRGEFPVGFCVAEVRNQGAVSGRTRGNGGFETSGSADEGVGDVNAHRGRFDISFDPGELPGDEEVGSSAEFEPGVEGFGGFDVRVAVDYSHADELGVFESGNHAEDFELGSPFHAGLTGNEGVESFLSVFGTELEGGPGAAIGAWIAETNGLEIAESEGVVAFGGNFFDGFASFKVLGVFEIFEGDAFGGDEGGDECVVLFLVERAVEIVVTFSFVVARLGEDDVAVKGGCLYGW